MGICSCLTKNYKKILYINADCLQTFQSFLNDRTVISAKEVYDNLANPNQEIFKNIRQTIRKESFSYLPPFKAALMSLGVPFKVFAMIAQSAKITNEYDFIVVDVNSAFDENLALLFKISDKIIVVTKNTDNAVFSTNLLVSNINGIGSEKYMFICNDCHEDWPSPKEEPNYQINEYVSHMKNYDELTCEDLAKNNEMQKIAFLLV
jgi:cellulose biosynthesis protein BcsQ